MLSNTIKFFVASSLLVVSQCFTIVLPKKSNKLLASKNEDDFDPLLSPHAYPNGTNNGPLPSSKKVIDNCRIEDEKDWSPLKLKNAKNDFEGASAEDYDVQKSTFTRQWAASTKVIEPSQDLKGKKEREIPSELFDPLLSPHAYPLGTNAGAVPVEQETIGILIIDHGSRRASSNEQLNIIAEMYQTRAPDNYVVKAAHMEIAEPSIYDSIRSLCQEGIKTIICHPYFLSPGRHVQEDIPQLIEEASSRLKQEGLVEELNIMTTEAVGSDLGMMVDLIEKKIEDTVGIKNMKVHGGFVTKGKSKDFGMLGGFFGEVQRMIDEQL